VSRRVLAFSDDLMDRSKLTTSLPDVELVRDAREAAGATCVIVDVGRYAEAIGAIRAVVPSARIVAYGRHDDPGALDAALAAGADVALARSRFFRDPAAAVAP
jgi:DNA-binding NarL/FixJ family response regulator